MFFPPLPVGSQELVFKVPKRGHFHAAIRVTPKRCDSCVQGALTLGKRAVSRRDFCDAESLVTRCGNFPSRYCRGVTLLVGIEMSYFRYPDFSIFFSVWRSLLTSNVQDVEAQKHAWVHPRKKMISMLNKRRQNLDSEKKISIPKRRLRPPRYHKEDISIPKKRCTLVRGGTPAERKRPKLFFCKLLSTTRICRH